MNKVFAMTQILMILLLIFPLYTSFSFKEQEELIKKRRKKMSEDINMNKNMFGDPKSKSRVIIHKNKNVPVQRSLQESSQCTGKKSNSFHDCYKYSANDNSTICCYVTGTSNGVQENSCLEVDYLFDGKTIEYTGSLVSGKLICGEGDIGSYLKINAIIIYLLFIMIL